MVISGDVYGFWTMAVALALLYSASCSIQYRSEAGYVGDNHSARWEWWLCCFHARYTPTLLVTWFSLSFFSLSICFESSCWSRVWGTCVQEAVWWRPTNLGTIKAGNEPQTQDFYQDNKTQLSLAKAKRDTDNKTELRLDNFNSSQHFAAIFKC